MDAGMYLGETEYGSATFDQQYVNGYQYEPPTF